MTMQMILGVVDMYTDLIVAAGEWGAMFFFFYIIFMFLILINIFLAILNDAYAGVKGDMEESAEDPPRRKWAQATATSAARAPLNSDSWGSFIKGRSAGGNICKDCQKTRALFDSLH